MKNIKKINLAEVSDKQALSMDQLSKIIGGGVDIACSSNVCKGGVMEANTKLCDKSAVCTSGATTCTTNADTDDKDEGDNKNDKPTCAFSICLIGA